MLAVAKDGLETRDASALRLTHRVHHAARFLDRRIDAGDFLTDYLAGAEVQIGARSVVVKDDGPVTVDRNDDVGGAVDKTLEVFLVECEHLMSLTSARAVRPAESW